MLVIEASSFQLHTVDDSFAPDVAVLLNLAADHLDWHGSFEAYVADKAQRCSRTNATDATLVVNRDDPAVVALARVGSGAPDRRFTLAARHRSRFGWDGAAPGRMPDGDVVLHRPPGTSRRMTARTSPPRPPRRPRLGATPRRRSPRRTRIS